MIDFKNGSFIKLKDTKKFQNESLIKPLFVPGEEFLGEYQAIRDFVIFTNKRVIAVNVQGMTGKKKDFTTLPYSKIQAFSIETAGCIFFIFLKSEKSSKIKGLRAFCCFINAEKILFSAP